MSGGGNEYKDRLCVHGYSGMYGKAAVRKTENSVCSSVY